MTTMKTAAPRQAPSHRLASQVSARVALLQSELARRDMIGLLIYASGTTESAGAVRYLLGWMPPSEVICWVPVDGDPVVVSNDKNAARAFALVLGGLADVIKTTDLIDSTAGVLAGVTRGTVSTAGFEEATSNRGKALGAILDKHDVVDGSPLVTSLRVHRTVVEQERQRAATVVADAMVQQAMRTAAIPGVTGMEIMAEVEYIGRRMGADRASCWLALGDRPAETYFQPFELAMSLTRQDRVQIGTTVMVEGYFSQVLRVGVFEEPTARLAEVSERLIDMQDSALGAMTPGSPLTVIGDVLESMIDELCPYSRPDDPFRFQSCHALGNSYSEPWSAPFLNADRDRAHDGESPAIEVHQTYEIHPNFTLPDLGHVCAGDVGLVTATGGEWISRTPRGILRLG